MENLAVLIETNISVIHTPCSLALVGFSMIPLLVDPSSIDAKGVYAIKNNAEYIQKRKRSNPPSAQINH